MSMFTMIAGPSRIKAIDAAKGTFEGYGAAFNNLDYNGDVIKPGAFKGTLQAAREQKATNKNGVLWPLLWMHDEAEPIGAILDAYEDSNGLYIKGMCDMDTELGRRAFSGLSKGYMNQFSIGYDTKRAGPGTGDARRTLLDVKLWEISVITAGYAANPNALVLPESVKFTLERKTREMGNYSLALEAMLAAAKAGETTSRTRTPAKAAPYAFAPEREQYASDPAGEKLYERDRSSFEYKVRDGKVRDAADLPRAPERKSYSSENEYERDLAHWQDTVGAALLGQHYGAVDDAREDRDALRAAYNGQSAPADAETKRREDQFITILQQQVANGDIQAAYKLRELTARRALAVR